MSGESNYTPKILGLCNPLLDVSANVDTDLLNKYQLKPNDSILASDIHNDLIQEVVSKYQVDYTPGGSAQNVVRVAAGILKRQQFPAKVMFSGCVGNDEYAQIMETRAKDDGVTTEYAYDKDTPTGTCAVLLTDHGKNRSNCAFLGASQKFSEKHLIDNWDRLVESTNIIYISGFLLPVAPEAFHLLGKHIAKKSDANGKIYRFMINLSAPYVSQVFGALLDDVIKYADVVFGNDDEAKAYAVYKKWNTEDIKEIAIKIMNEEKIRTEVPRAVIITQGHNPVILAEKNREVKSISCEQLSEDMIVDTNGAGDSFCGGFLSQYIQGKDLDCCIKVGCYAASEIIKVSGVVIPSFEKLPSV